MILNKEQLSLITCGAEDIVTVDNGFTFRRFTESQSQYYAIYRNDDYMKKTWTAAGVRLAFKTDSTSLSFDYAVRTVPGAGYAYFDVYADGVMIDHFGVDGGEHDMHADVTLGEGEKTVEVYLPWSKYINMSNIALDDGASLVPVKRSRVMINYGDSITHGYYAKYPSLSYASRLAKALDADNYNKAIGGDRFFPELLELDEAVKPDIVTVAYGTNDWCIHTKKTLAKRSREFLVKLSKKYPDAKIFVITPIWRSAPEVTEKFGGVLTEVHELLCENSADLKNITVIDGMHLVAHVGSFYTDGLHPNDLGMSIYAENLAREMLKYL